MTLSTTQITSIYQSLYGRNPSATEVNAAQTVDATFGDQVVVTTLVNAPETSTYDFAVYTIIKAATGIAPTQAQISGWVSYLEQTAPGAAAGSFALIQAELSMVNAFANSVMFQATYNISPTALSTNAFVTALVANTQGTVATQAQLNAWGTGSGFLVNQVFAAFATNDASVAANKAAIITLLTNYADLAAGITAPITTFNLTTSIDNFTGVAAGNNAFVAVDVSGAQTWTGLDAINGGGGPNNTFTVTSATAISQPPGATVTGVQTAIIAEAGAAAGITLNTTAWTGLTQLTTINAGTGTTTLTTAATTNVNASTPSAGNIVVAGGNNVTTSTAGGATTIGGASPTASPVGTISATVTAAAAAGTMSIDGGTSVTATQTGASFATAATADITIGANVAPTGAVIVNATTGTATGNTIGAISIKGGTIDTITESAGDAAATGTNVVMGNVAVTGTTTTTSVTVTQAAVATGQTAVAAVAGVVNVAAIAAAPGVQPVSAIAGVTPIIAVAAAVGVTSDGTVNIADKVAASSTTATAGGVSGGTIASVSLTNFGSANISSPALTTLTLGGTASGSAVNLYEGGTLGATNTTLTLNLNGLSGAPTLTDNSSQFTTFNIVAGASASALGAITDAALTTITVSGSSVLTMAALPGTVTAVTVTGAAGYKGAISDTTTTFNGGGSSGADTITIAADATKAITGGSGTGDEIIANAAGGTFSAANTGVKVTGFETLGITAATTGTTNASVFGAAINKIDVTATGVASILTSVNQNATINFAKAAVSTTSLAVNYADVSGASDAVAISFAGASTSNAATGAITNVAQAVTSLTLQDANGVGIGTLSFSSADIGFNAQNDSVATLLDNNVTTMNFSGTGGMAIGATAFSNNATAMTIGNTGTNAAGDTVTMTDNSLGGLTFTGTGKTTVNLTDHVGGTIAITNSGTGSVSVTDDGATVAANLNLTGAMTVNFTDGNVTSLTLAAGQNVTFTDSNTGGVTIAGAADNSHVTLSLTGGAVVTKTDTISLGNANNIITDASSAGTVSVSVGSGANLIDVHTGGNNATYSANITLAAHANTATAFDQIDASVTGSQAVGFSTAITGTAVGDQIQFNDANQAVLTTFTAGQLAAIAASGTLATAISTAFGDLPGTAHQVAEFQYGADTYVIENVGADTAFTAGTDSVVKLVGAVHTISAVTNAGHAIIAIAT